MYVYIYFYVNIFICMYDESKYIFYKQLTFNSSNKNGDAAHNTILCAGKLRPPAAKVQSTKSL